MARPEIRLAEPDDGPAGGRGPATPGRDDLLHLLWVYESIIAVRPLDRGNQGFLRALIRSARLLGDELERVEPQDAADAARTAALASCLRRQGPANGAAVARDALARIRLLHRDAGERLVPEALYLDRLLAPLRERYAAIQVVFGPGIGMGDEITFHGLVAALARRYPASALTIFDVYPGLWSLLLPRARSHDYRGHPWRPFRFLERERRAEARGPTLVVAADFDGYCLHGRVIGRRPERDVLEIALGLRKAWLRRGDSPWVETHHFPAPRFASHYTMLSELAGALLGPEHRPPAWAPLSGERHGRRASAERALLLNPLSSKPVPLGPADWRAMLSSALDALPPAARLRVHVFTGVDDDARAEARRLTEHLAREPRVSAQLLAAPDGGALTPANGLAAVASVLREVDLCVTIDTFTAHLAPLLRVPTVVVALRENRAFWVPSRHAFYTTIDEAARELPLFVARIVEAPARRPRALRSAAGGLVASTDRALAAGASLDRIEAIRTELARYLLALHAASPERGRCQRWLRFFTRLAAAAKQTPVEPTDLEDFVQRFADSDLVKLASLSA